MTTIPELEPHCGSWIVTSPSGVVAVELFERSNVELAARNGFRIETATAYLGRINGEIRAKQLHETHLRRTRLGLDDY